MNYEKPEVRDFGSIAEHTYTFGGRGGRWFGGKDWKDCEPGGSGQVYKNA